MNSPRKLDFFSEAFVRRAEFLPLPHAVPAYRIPAGTARLHLFGSFIDAKKSEAVIRTTLLRYTLKLLPVNTFLDAATLLFEHLS